MMRVLMIGDDPVALRAAASLAAHPDITLVGMDEVNPPGGWAGRMIRATTRQGFDVMVGGVDASLRSVTIDDRGTVCQASPIGLARSLATRCSQPARIVLTEPGKAKRSPRYFDFPSPIGRLLTRMGPDGVERCPTEASLAAVGASDADHILAVVDHPAFLAGICLAAGVFLLNHPGPVWHQPERYLEVCSSMGLVIAESDPK